MSFFILDVYFHVRLICVATLAQNFKSLSKISKVLSNIFGLCIHFWSLYSLFGALYNLSELCIVCWGFVLSVRALYNFRGFV